MTPELQAAIARNLCRAVGNNGGYTRVSFQLHELDARYPPERLTAILGGDEPLPLDDLPVFAQAMGLLPIQLRIALGLRARHLLAA